LIVIGTADCRPRYRLTFMEAGVTPTIGGTSLAMQRYRQCRLKRIVAGERERPRNHRHTLGENVTTRERVAPRATSNGADGAL